MTNARNILTTAADRRTYRLARARGEAPGLALYRVRTEQACRETMHETSVAREAARSIEPPYREPIAAYRVDVDALARHTSLYYPTGNLASGQVRPPRVALPAGTTVALFVYRDESSTPDDFECYSPEDVAAWREDDWQYVGVSAVVRLADGRTGEAALWGIEQGRYWPGTDEADVWHAVEDIVAEAAHEAGAARLPDATALDRIAETLAAAAEGDDADRLIAGETVASIVRQTGRVA